MGVIIVLAFAHHILAAKQTSGYISLQALISACVACDLEQSK